MTGFVGLIAAKDREIAPTVGQTMADAIAYMGPDRQDQYQSNGLFMAHALLATTREDVGSLQPLSFDGVVRLVADARIDGRDALIDALREAGRTVSVQDADSALILHAWHVWGERCVERLIGDFAFAIWDENSRTLFAARDHFGSVPLYHALVGDTFLFGNAVPGLLAYSGLDRALNPVAIADYLMFGYSLEPSAGFYRHIDRLPPAHCMRFREGKVTQWRYWTLPEPDFSDAERMPADDLVAQFRAVLESAVSDRMRTSKVATTLSGGMDSTLLTALAMREPSAQVDAYSFGADWMVPDVERHWAWHCAYHIGVPFHSISIERAYINPPGGHFRVPPEPRMEIKTSSFHLVGDRLAEDGIRVLIMGMGGDAIVNGGVVHWVNLIQRRAFARLAGEVRAYWRYHRRRPPLRAVLSQCRPRVPVPRIAPLDLDLVRTHHLEQRWADWQESYRTDPRRGMTTHPFWTEMLVASHPESSGLPVRVRQPFFDVRLLEAAMRLPPSPWQFNKAILRRIGEGLLPDEIVRRPKTPFGANPALEAARRGLEPWLASLPDARELDGYVDRAKLAHAVRNLDQLKPMEYSATLVLPGGLAAWLRNK